MRFHNKIIAYILTFAMIISFAIVPASAVAALPAAGYAAVTLSPYLMFLLNCFVYFLVFVKLFDLLTRKYVNNYTCYFLYGPRGSGKTLTEVKLAVRYMRKGWLVYTDMPELILPGVRFFKWKDLGEFVPEENSLLILSEVGTKFDKRNFKSFTEPQRDFFIFLRKYKVICFMDSQDDDADIKIRSRLDGY